MQRTSQLTFIVAAAFAMAVGAHAQQHVPATPGAPGAASGALSTAKLPAPNLSALQGNVQTVEALIKAENELALHKARKERIQAGLEQEAPAMQIKTKGPVPLMVEVESIAGVGGRLRAFLSAANGQRYENVGVGARVQSCQIEAIQNRCIVFRPAAANVKAQQCPTACWTGQRREPVLATGPAGMPPLPGQALPGGPLPMPMGGAIAQPQPLPVQSMAVPPAPPAQ